MYNTHKNVPAEPTVQFPFYDYTILICFPKFRTVVGDVDGAAVGQEQSQSHLFPEGPQLSAAAAVGAPPTRQTYAKAREQAWPAPRCRLEGRAPPCRP